MNSATGSPLAWLRLEGATVLLTSVVFYEALHAAGHASWIWFAVLFLAPDLSMLGFVGGLRTGAIAYNTVHNYVLPLLLLVSGVILRHPFATAPYALIWTAHIGMDRALAYGLKYSSGFGATHLGKKGKVQPITVGQESK